MPAVEDVPEGGNLDDWRDLAREILANPAGTRVQSLRTVLSCYDGYGTARLMVRISSAGWMPAPESNRDHAG